MYICYAFVGLFNKLYKMHGTYILIEKLVGFSFFFCRKPPKDENINHSVLDYTRFI